MKKLKSSLKEFLQNIQFRIYKYSVEEMSQSNKPILGSRKLKIMIYSKIHQKSDWRKEYGFYLKCRTDLEVSTAVGKVLNNIKNLYQWLEENDFFDFPMCSYKNLMARIIDFDFSRKRLYIEIIDSAILNYLPLKSKKISVNIVEEFHKIVLYKQDEIKVVGNSVYLNGEHKIFRSKVSLEKYLDTLLNKKHDSSPTATEVTSPSNFCG